MGSMGPEVPRGTGESAQVPLPPPNGAAALQLWPAGQVEEYGLAQQDLSFQEEPKNWIFL